MKLFKIFAKERKPLSIKKIRAHQILRELEARVDTVMVEHNIQLKDGFMRDMQRG